MSLTQQEAFRLFQDVIDNSIKRFLITLTDINGKIVVINILHIENIVDNGMDKGRPTCKVFLPKGKYFTIPQTAENLVKYFAHGAEAFAPIADEDKKEEVLVTT